VIDLSTVDTCLSTVGRDDLMATIRELAHLARLQHANLTRVQTRCTELLDITRIQRGMIPVQTVLADVLETVNRVRGHCLIPARRERRRATVSREKWLVFIAESVIALEARDLAQASR